MKENTVRLETLNEQIKEEYLSLEVGESQKNYIETARESLNDLERHGWNIDWTIECIYTGDTMIGYAMHGMSRDGNAWLDRFMIDKHFQGRGYGTKALPMLLARIRERYPDRKHTFLSVEKHNKTAIALYEKYGFRMTDELDGKDPVMMLQEK